jgi:predicted nucleic acid-binding protein
MNAVDTNVLIYSLDNNEPVKQAKAKVLLGELVANQRPTILPWQVAGELLNWLGKWESSGAVSKADAEDHFRDILSLFPLMMPTAQLFSIYFQLRSRFTLSHWDAMLLAACREAGVTTLFSEDLDSGTDYDGLAVVNPLV